MTDATPAPPSASALPSPECAAHWPAASEWPAQDASSLEWARFYTQRLGLRVLPTPSPVDRIGHARFVASEAEAKYKEEHGGQTPAQSLREQMWSDARDFANAVRGPIPRLVKARKDRDCTEEDLHLLWGVDPKRVRDTQHQAERGCCILLGVGRWWVPAQVDVDPRASGDIGGSWATLPGPHVATPRGGVHVFVDARSTHVHSSDKVLAPGVEVRTAGYAVLPSGPSTPGRAWTSPEPPRPPPHALLVAPPRPPKRAVAVLNAEADPWDNGASGRVATLIRTDVGSNDGRTSVLRAIIGMLAQPRGAPEDVVQALLAMLTEYGTGRDWPRERLAEETARWQHLLTRGPRDAEFAVEVATTWEQTRDIGPVRKGDAWARNTARSIWKTANRREEGKAGAEDIGHGTQVGERDPWVDDVPRYAMPPAAPPALPSTAPSPTATHAPTPTVDPHAAANAAVATLAAEVSAGDADAQRAAINEFRLRRFMISVADEYTIESMERDMSSTPIKVDHLYPFYNFLTQQPEKLDDNYLNMVGHGYGKWLAPALDNISEGDFMALGAAGAKGGKTHFLGQMADGLALGTAARILGVPGYADHPVVLVVWASEMVKRGEVFLRMAGRHYGFDFAAIRKGNVAAEARGVIHMSESLGLRPESSLPRMTPAQVVMGARHIMRSLARDEKTPCGMALKHVVKTLRLGELPNPKGQGRQRVDYRSGPNLVGFISDACAIYRRDLANLAGVSEDKVLCLLILDPGQRFAGDADNSKGALDSLLEAVPYRITSRDTGVGGACIMTSDTTKAAARDLDLECFLSEPSGQKLAADIFAGSQAIMHHCDVFAVCGDDSLGDHFRRTQWVRVLQGRTGASSECYPFSWETHTGRFRPRKAEPLRKVDPDRAGGRFGGRGRSQRRPPMLAGPEVGEHTPGPKTAPYRPNAVRPRHEPRDD